MSFQQLSSPTPSGERTESQNKRPNRLSVFRFASTFQSTTSRTPSHSPPAYSPDDVIAERNKLHIKVIHWMRIAIALITILVSIIIIAFPANVLHIYTNTRYNTAEWILPLWPATVDLRPTHAVLACGIILLVFSLVYLIIALAPTVCHLCHQKLLDKLFEF